MEEKHQCTCHQNNADHHHDCSCGCGHSHDSHLDDLAINDGLEISLELDNKLESSKFFEILTEDPWVSQWLPNGQFIDLRAGGKLKIGDQDYLITDYQDSAIIAFMTDYGILNLDLASEADSSIKLQYWVEELNQATITELTRWLIRLNNIQYLASNEELIDEEIEFETMVEEVQDLLFSEIEEV
ncbi:hypothetical protein ACWOBE_02650 [Hutsoniella sourekii]